MLENSINDVSLAYLGVQLSFGPSHAMILTLEY